MSIAPETDAAAQLGTRFAEALARTDYEAVEQLLHPDVDFRAATPNCFWEAAGPRAVIDEVLHEWFDGDQLEGVESVETGSVGGERTRVGYLIRGRDEDGPFVFEQQAYLEERDGRIAWMRVLCSGYQRPG